MCTKKRYGVKEQFFTKIWGLWQKLSSSAQWLKWSGQAGGSGDGGIERVGNLAHFEHKRTIF